MAAVEILRVHKQSATAKSFEFIHPYKASPGQFLMVWLPGMDEVPMSLSRIDKDIKEITVENVGEATKALHKLVPGKRIGVRGPYGNGYALPRKKRFLLLAGGSGAASLTPVAEMASKLGSETTVVLGARTADKLILEKRLRGAAKSIVIATDDGSKGVKGFATNVAEKLMDEGKFDLVLTCGPEVMMHKVVEAARDREIPVQASLERYMKCGLGVCGSCAFGRFRVCADGPVFTGEQLKSIDDFGKTKLAPDGRRIGL